METFSYTNTTNNKIYTIILSDEDNGIKIKIESTSSEEEELFKGKINLDTLKNAHQYFFSLSNSQDLLNILKEMFEQKEISIIPKEEYAELQINKNIDYEYFQYTIIISRIKLSLLREVNKLKNELIGMKKSMNNNHIELKQMLKNFFNIQQKFIKDNNKVIKEEYIHELKNQIKDVKSQISLIDFPFKRTNQRISYKENPCELTYYKDIENNVACSIKNIYEIYSNQNEDLILVYPLNDNLIYYNLITFDCLYSIEKPFNETIASIRHYFDGNEEEDLIIVSSERKVTKIFNDDYNNILTINDCGNFIHSSFIFNDDNELYILISDIDYNFLYDYNGKFISKIGEQLGKGQTIFYGNAYYEKKITYIILCGKCGMYSYDIKKKAIYKQYINEYNSCSYGYTITNINNVTSIITNYSSSIKIFNFHTGQLVNNINFDNGNFYHFCLWDSSKIFIGNEKNNNILLIDIKDKKVIKQLEGHMKKVLGKIKKIIHPFLGECLISHGDDNKLKMWKLKE